MKQKQNDYELYIDDEGFTKSKDLGWDSVVWRVMDTVRLALLKLNEDMGIYRYVKLINYLDMLIEGKIKTAGWTWAKEYTEERQKLKIEYDKRCGELFHHLNKKMDDIEKAIMKERLEVEYYENVFRLIMVLFGLNNKLPQDETVINDE